MHTTSNTRHGHPTADYSEPEAAVAEGLGSGEGQLAGTALQFSIIV